MSLRCRKFITLALFAIFLANLCVWNFHTRWISHTLAHTSDAALMVASADHSAQDHAGSGDKKTPSAAEHQLLHAADHLQLFPSTIVPQSFAARDGAVLAGFRLPAVPLAQTESPFRPPCCDSLLA